MSFTRAAGKCIASLNLSLLTALAFAAPAATLAARPVAPSHAAASSAAPASSAAVGDPHVGNGNTTTPAYYRSLVPSTLIEQQSTLEYRRLLASATQQKRLVPANNAQVIKLRAIVARLVPFSLKWNDSSKTWNWEVNLIRSPKIDALALPAGKIIVYTGMLDRLHLNDDEIALLLSHEIAHAVREHARTRIGEEEAQRLGRGAPPPTNASAAAISASRVAAVAQQSSAQFGQLLVNMHYNADDETEADVIGADIASRAGYDPRAAIIVWQKLDAMSHRTRIEFLVTHPYSESRRADLIKRLPDMLPLYARAINKTVDTLPRYAGVPAVPASRTPAPVSGSGN